MSWHAWADVPMTDTEINRVEAFGMHDQQLIIQVSSLVVVWRPDLPLSEDEYDVDYQDVYNNRVFGYGRDTEGTICLTC